MKLSYRYKWYHFIWRWLYCLALLILSPIILLKLLSKKADSSDSGYHQNRQRFGLYPKAMRPGGIIVHCVSMGEVNAAEGLVKVLLETYPELPITLTCTSTTGAQQAVHLYADSVQHAYLPIDFPLFNYLMLAHLKPQVLLITEVEIWPNLIHQCYKQKVASILINARMTDKAVANYQKLAFLFRPTLRKFTAICPQSETDFANFISLGVYKQQLHLSRNLKFDLQKSAKDEEKAKLIRATFELDGMQVIAAASTHETEEKTLLECYARLKNTHPNIVLFLVPRYPHRFEEVALLVNAMGFKSSTLSAPRYKSDNEVIIIDQMGMLKAVYSLASFSFVGGSLVEKGGHNPLESALYGAPVCMGPSIYNNPTIVRLLEEKQALKIVQDNQMLYQSFDFWLSDIAALREAGESAFEVISNNAGATQRTMEVIIRCISESALKRN